MVPLDQRLQAPRPPPHWSLLLALAGRAYSLMLDETDPAEVNGTIGARLRLAWVAAT